MSETSVNEILQPFCSELLSVYQTKLPLSRSKVHSVTKAAMKAIRFYKHVVMNLEKFIQKCGPEYKLPALYIMDSIIRQSKYQHGDEKDVFAPRFSKNIHETFENLYKCRNDDKSKITRVLKLWSENHIFNDDITQPLLAIALSNEDAKDAVKLSSEGHSDVAGDNSSQAVESQQNVFKNIQSLDNSVLKDMLKRAGAATSTSATKPYNRENLLDDFDYGDDEDDAARIAEQKKRLAEEESRRQSEAANTASTMDIIDPAEILNQYQQILASASTTDRVLSDANVTGYNKETPVDDPDVIPPSQPEKVTVCSRTIFVGHLPRSVGQERISETFEQYGSVKSVDLIPPRGCAFVSMHTREGAVKAVRNLQNLRIQNSNCKVAWAPGKGIKGRFKDCWNVDLGVSYIPWSALREDTVNVEMLEDGGYIDRKTLPPGVFIPDKVEESNSMTAVQTNEIYPTNERYPSLDNNMDGMTASKIPVLQRSSNNDSISNSGVINSTTTVDISNNSNGNDLERTEKSNIPDNPGLAVQRQQGGIPTTFSAPPPPSMQFRGAPPLRAPMGGPPSMHTAPPNHPIGISFPPFPPNLRASMPPVDVSMNHPQPLMAPRPRADFGQPPPLHQFPSLLGNNINTNSSNNNNNNNRMDRNTVGFNNNASSTIDQVAQEPPQENIDNSNNRRNNRYHDNRKRYRDDRNDDNMHDRRDDRNFGSRNKRERRYSDSMHNSKRDRRSRASRWDDRNDR